MARCVSPNEDEEEQSGAKSQLRTGVAPTEFRDLLGGASKISGRQDAPTDHLLEGEPNAGHVGMWIWGLYISTVFTLSRNTARPILLFFEVSTPPFLRWEIR